MKLNSFLFLALILSLTSCKSYYQTTDFKNVTAEHKTIAILPFEIVTKGFLPEELSENAINEIKEKESLTFQASYHNKILRSTRRGKKALRVNVQHYKKTRSILEDKNISVLDSWIESPETLANMLGVDAVVAGRIEKEKFFSDELSAGIQIGGSILRDAGLPGVPYVSHKNKNILTDFSIIDSEEGNVLWSINYTCRADWADNTNLIVDQINAKSTRHFPYRTK